MIYMRDFLLFNHIARVNANRSIKVENQTKKLQHYEFIISLHFEYEWFIYFFFLVHHFICLLFPTNRTSVSNMHNTFMFVGFSFINFPFYTHKEKRLVSFIFLVNILLPTVTFFIVIRCYHKLLLYITLI